MRLESNKASRKAGTHSGLQEEEENLSHVEQIFTANITAARTGVCGRCRRRPAALNADRLALPAILVLLLRLFDVANLGMHLFTPCCHGLYYSGAGTALRQCCGIVDRFLQICA